MKDLLFSLLDLLFPQKNRASRVATITASDLSGNVAVKSFSQREILIHALLPYETALVRDVIWALKYSKSAQAAKLLSEVLADYLLEETSDADLFGETTIAFIPVPLSAQRLHERGYNQSAWILELTLKILKKEKQYCPNALERIIDTKPQTRLSRDERLHNVRGAFSVKDPKAVADHHCVLIDDVVTTGSTLASAADALKKAGSRSVTCVALAYARLR